METTKYPEDQRVLRCLPQYGNLCFAFKYDADFAFKAPITFPNVSCGESSKIKWMWSDSPFISVILIFISSAIFGKVSIISWRMFV